MNELTTAIPALNTTENEPKRGLSRKVIKAIDYIARGQVSSQKAAAEKAGLSEAHLCRVLKTSRAQLYLADKTRETLSTGKLRAASKLVELLDGESSHVAKDAAIHLLRLAGFVPPEGQSQVNIHGGTCFVGHVINWKSDTEDDGPGETIDITPEPDEAA